jgi:hypothetical protein
MRRALLFSCYRNYDLALAAFHDTITMFKTGVSEITSALKTAQHAFEESQDLELSWCNDTLVFPLQAFFATVTPGEDYDQFIQCLETDCTQAVTKDGLMLQLTEIE